MSLSVLAPIAPLEGLTAALGATLRARLVEVGYSPDALGAAENLSRGIPFNTVHARLVCWQLRTRTAPASRLLRLFMYDDALSVDEAREALGDALWPAARDVGLVAEGPDGVRACFHLIPFHDLWILGDARWTERDAVMGATTTTDTLSRWLDPRAGASVLDVGCGAGSLALLAARRGARATGTDVNPRAIALARINARLNGVEAEFVEGSLYEPVAGRRFDLVVAQPPYIPRAPDVADVTILYGGAWGDELALRFVAECPAVLTDQGVGVFLFETAVRQGQPLHARLRAMMPPGRVDLALAHTASIPATMEAAMYAAVEHERLDDAFIASAERRWAHFESLGVKEFMSVLAVLRARPPEGVPAGVTAARVATLRHGDPAHLAAWMGGLDLARRDDDALARAAVSVSPGHAWVEERTGPDLSLEPKRTLRFHQALAATRELSEATWALLALLHDSDDVADATARYAELCGVTAAQMRPQVLGFVREMLFAAVLCPRGASGAPRGASGA